MADNKKSSIGGKSTCHLLNVKQPDRNTKRIKFTFQRTAASISVLKTGRSVGASMSFIDISETGAGFFTEELLLKGSTVEVCVTEPHIVKVKGIVAWSVPVKSGVQSARFGFRSGVQFIFDNEIQRTALVEFITRVNSDPLESAKSGTIPPAAEPVSNADAPVATAPAAPVAEGAPPAPEAAAPLAEVAAPPLAEPQAAAQTQPAAESVAAPSETSSEEPKAA